MTDAEIRALLELAEKARGHPVPAMAGHECVWIDCEYRSDIPALCRDLLAARAMLRECRLCSSCCGCEKFASVLGEEVMP